MAFRPETIAYYGDGTAFRDVRGVPCGTPRTTIWEAGNEPRFGGIEVRDPC